MQAQRLERCAGENEREEAAERKTDRARIVAPQAPEHCQRAKRDQPVGGKAEQVEQDVRQPGAERAAGVPYDRVAAGVRPARIAAIVGDEQQQQVERRRTEKKPLRFAYQTREPCGKRRRAALVCYGQGYSGSMMVSRSTMLEPRISI